MPGGSFGGFGDFLVEACGDAGAFASSGVFAFASSGAG